MRRFDKALTIIVLLCLPLVAGCLSSPVATLPPVTPTATMQPATPQPTPSRSASAVVMPSPATSFSPRTTPGRTPVPTPSAEARAPDSQPAPLNLGVPVGNIYYVQAAALDRAHGLLYALGNQDGTTSNEAAISIVDLAQGKVVATIALTATLDYPGAISVSADGGRLFIFSGPGRRETNFVAIETGIGQGQRGRTLFATSDVTTFALDPAADKLYILDGATIRQLDALTFREERSVLASDLAPVPPALQLSVNSPGQRLYLSRPTGVVSVYATDDLRHIGDVRLAGRIKGFFPHPHRANTYAIVESLASGLPADTVVVLRDADVVASWPQDPAFSSGRIVVNDSDGRVLLLEDSRDALPTRSRIRILDAATGQTVTTIALPSLNLEYARYTATYLNRLYLVSDLVLPITLATGELGQPLYVGVNLVGAALDQASGRLFVLDSAGYIHVVATVQFREVATWHSPVAIGPRMLNDAPLAVGGGRLYVADTGANVTHVLDSNSNSGMLVTTIARAGRVSIDTKRNLLYLTNQGVYIVDATTYAITGVISGTVREHPQLTVPGAIAATYDAGFDWLFVTMSNNSPGSSNHSWLQIYEASTGELISSTIKADQQFVSGVATDSAGGQVWISSSFPSRNITHFEADGRIRTRLMGIGNSIFVDPARHRLYASDWSGIVAVDTHTDTVVGYRRLPFLIPNLMLYDLNLHRFYVNGSGSARLWAIDPDVPAIAASHVATLLPAARVHMIAADATGTAFVGTSPDGPRTGLWRQTAEGWVSFADRLPPLTQGQLVAAPDVPGVLFAFDANPAGGAGLFRSQDGGVTWQVATAGLKDLRVMDMVLSPRFSEDGTGVLLTAGGAAYLTVNRGQTWQQIPDVGGSWLGLTAMQGRSVGIFVMGQDPQSPDRAILFHIQGGVVGRQTLDLPRPWYEIQGMAVAADDVEGGVLLLSLRNNTITGQPAGLVLSRDMGRTWRFVGPVTTVRNPRYSVLFSPGFIRDRTMYTLISPLYGAAGESSLLARSQDGGQTWQRAVNTDPTLSAIAMRPDGRLWVGNAVGEVKLLDPATISWQPMPLPVPSPTPTVPPTPAPTPAPPPTPTAFAPDPRFEQVYRSRAGLLGAAAEPAAREVWGAVQAFEKGRMIWREDTRLIYVLFSDGTWSAYDDTWVEGQPEQDAGIVPPAGKVQPRRGFGKLWRSVPGLREQLGWALHEEEGHRLILQDFRHGLLIRQDGSTYILGRLADKTVWIVE